MSAPRRERGGRAAAVVPYVFRVRAGVPVREGGQP